MLQYKPDDETVKKIISILNDLKNVLKNVPLHYDKWLEIKSSLKNEEVVNYIDDLFNNVKPEEAFSRRIFEKLLSLSKSVGKIKEYRFEQKIQKGWVDYIIQLADGKVVLLEVKPMLRKKGNMIDIVELKYEDHTSQIERYLREGYARGIRYIILTNISSTYIFSATNININEPIADINIDDLISVIREQTAITIDYFIRLEGEKLKHVLDEEFFKSLKKWIERLRKVKFKVDSRLKDELILTLISKFIFIQTLDDHNIVPYMILKNEWDRAEKLWKPKGEKYVVEEFLKNIDKWFYEYYDTELFKKDIISFVDENNYKEFYEALKDVLGLRFYEWYVEPFMGILRFNYKLIDEDILGKAYELILAELAGVEKGKLGTYYTPKHIVNYLVNEVINMVVDPYIKEFKDYLAKKEYNKAKQVLEKILSIRIIDPACGSGSFLIKAVKALYNVYNKLEKILIENISKKLYHPGDLSPYFESDSSSKEEELLKWFKKEFGSGPIRVSKILLRHIFGVDIDPKATEIAKINLWLHSIKLVPNYYHYTKLQNKEVVLPRLDLNIVTGDSLFGMSPETIASIDKNDEKYSTMANELRKLWLSYINDINNENLINEAIKIREELINQFGKARTKYCESIHWPLHFVHILLFDEGFTIVIGNPPHGAKYEKELVEILKRKYKYLAKGGIDSAEAFVGLAYSLLKPNGILCFVMPKPSTYSQGWVDYRNFILDKWKVELILDLGKAFKDVRHEQVAIIAIKKVVDKYTYSGGYATEDVIKIVNKDLDKNLAKKLDVLLTNIDKDELKIGKKIISVSDTSLGKVVSDICRGIPRKYKTSQPGVQCLKGREIHRYYIEGPTEFVKENINKLNRILKEKVIAQRIIAHITKPKDRIIIMGFPDRYKYATFETVTNIIPGSDKKNLSIESICGILNSNLISWYVYRFIYNKAVRDMDFDKFFINKIPIPLRKLESLSTEIGNYVRALVALYQLRRKWIALWNRYTNMLKKEEFTLNKIIEYDKKRLTDGERPILIRYIETYVSEENKYNVLYIDTMPDNRLIIYGIKENEKNILEEDKLLEIGCTSNEICEHIYVSLIIDSEATYEIKVLNKESLSSIYGIKIPLIRPLDKTYNIVLNVMNDLERETGKYVKLTDIDKEIEKLESKVDTLVFKAYDLGIDDIKKVLNDQGMTPRYQLLVKKYYTSSR